jgi:hypothetical protein
MYLLNQLEISTPVHFESALHITGTKTDRIIEICRKLGADVYLSGSGGRAYLDEEKFRRSGIILKYQEFVHPSYHQQYSGSGVPFTPYMSCIDLLFNAGDRSRDILKGELAHV